MKVNGIVTHTRSLKVKCVEEKNFKDFSSCLQMCGKFCFLLQIN